jgi:hypothetical protein
VRRRHPTRRLSARTVDVGPICHTVSQFSNIAKNALHEHSRAIRNSKHNSAVLYQILTNRWRTTNERPALHTHTHGQNGPASRPGVSSPEGAEGSGEGVGRAPDPRAETPARSPPDSRCACRSQRQPFGTCGHYCGLVETEQSTWSWWDFFLFPLKKWLRNG